VFTERYSRSSPMPRSVMSLTLASAFVCVIHSDMIYGPVWSLGSFGHGAVFDLAVARFGLWAILDISIIYGPFWSMDRFSKSDLHSYAVLPLSLPL